MSSTEIRTRYKKTFNASEQAALRAIGELIQFRFLTPEALEVRYVTAGGVINEGLRSEGYTFRRSVLVKSERYTVEVDLFSHNTTLGWTATSVCVREGKELTNYRKDYYGADAYRWSISPS